MKKILSLVLALVLLLPIVVNADVQNLKAYYNERVLDGGEIEVIIPVKHDVEYNISISYDEKYVSINEDSVVISEKTHSKVDGDKVITVDNLKEVKVEKDKVSIKTKMGHPEAAIDYDGTPTIKFFFTAKAVGTVNLNIDAGRSYMINSPKVVITANTVNSGAITNCVPADQEPVSSSDDTSDINDSAITPSDDADSTSDVIIDDAYIVAEKTEGEGYVIHIFLFAISLIFNILLSITVIVLIILLVVSKSKKTKQ